MTTNNPAVETRASGGILQCMRSFDSSGIRGPSGLQSERDIHRRPFEVCPIPLFDPKRELHRQIAGVAREAREKMLKWRSKIGGKAARVREAGRKVVQAELDRLDPWVAELLNGHELVAQIKQESAKAQMLLPRT